MASAELRKLYKLHLVDTTLLEIRKRAAALDPGTKTAGEIKLLQTQLETAPARKLQSELTDLELRQATLQEKQQKHEKDLYGGKVVNPREVEAIEKEIGILKQQRSDLEDRMLEIIEALPGAKAGLDKIEHAIAERKKLLARQQKDALGEKSRLEAEFKQRSAERPLLAKEIPPTLLAKYESIRQKHGGIGMAEVVKKSNCSGCGTLLPERSLQHLKEDKTVSCESCHRILYFTEGVV